MLYIVSDESSEKVVNKVKRSSGEDWGLCPKNVDPQDCFQQYMSVWLRTVGPRHRSNFRGREVVGKRRAEQGPAGLQEWPFCPAWMPRVQCFDQYLSLWLNGPAVGEADAAAGKSRLAQEKRGIGAMAGQHICPPGMRKEECFHSMMSTWIKDLMVRYPRSASKE